MNWAMDDVRAGLRTVLATITGVTAYATMPAQPIVPAAIVSVSPGQVIEYDSPDSATLHLMVLVLVKKVMEDQAQADLDALIDYDDATKSAAVKLDGAVNAAWDSVQVTDIRQYAAYTFGAGETAQVYLGAEIPLDVLVS